jgi:hypothetical protein
MPPYVADHFRRTPYDNWESLMPVQVRSSGPNREEGLLLSNPTLKIQQDHMRVHLRLESHLFSFDKDLSLQTCNWVGKRAGYADKSAPYGIPYAVNQGDNILCMQRAIVPGAQRRCHGELRLLLQGYTRQVILPRRKRVSQSSLALKDLPRDVSVSCQKGVRLVLLDNENANARRLCAAVEPHAVQIYLRYTTKVAPTR